MAIQDYVTPTQVKAYAPTNEISTSTVWDAMITTLCTNLSRAFDLLTWRNPGDFAVVDTNTKYFDGIPITATDYQDILNIGELAALPTTVTINGVTIASTDYWGFPYNALIEYKPFTALRLNPAGVTKSWGAPLRGIAVTGLFGYSTTVPPDVYEALLLYAIRFVRKAQQNYLETGTILDTGQVMIGMREDTDLAGIITLRKNSRLPGRGGSSALGGW